MPTKMPSSSVFDSNNATTTTRNSDSSRQSFAQVDRTPPFSNDVNCNTNNTSALSLRQVIAGAAVACFTAIIYSTLWPYDHPTAFQTAIKKSAAAEMIDRAVMEALPRTLLSLSLMQNRTLNIPTEEVELFVRKRKTNYSDIPMTPFEIDMVLRHVLPCHTYLEFGSGGTTRNFASYAQARAISIEHNASRCMSRNQQLSGIEHRVDFHCVPVDSSYDDNYHVPDLGNDKFDDKFIDYVMHIDSVFDKLRTTSGSKQLDSLVDVVLNDGAARLATSVKMLQYLSKDGLLILHDANRLFDDRYDGTPRPYQLLWEFYDSVESVGGLKNYGLAVLKRKRRYSYLQGNRRAVSRILRERLKMSIQLK